MTAVVRAQGLGKRYGRHWALAQCTVDIPAGREEHLMLGSRLNPRWDMRKAVTYHPQDRFWRFQAYETAIFGGLTALLVGLCFLRIRPN